MENNYENYNAVITGNVFFDNTLPANAKLLYGLISSLSNKSGYCWASNERLAKYFGKDERSIRNWLNKLIKKGCIFVIHEQSKDEYPGRRRLYISYLEYKQYKAERKATSGKNFPHERKKFSKSMEKIFQEAGKNFPLYKEDKLINKDISSSFLSNSQIEQQEEEKKTAILSELNYNESELYLSLKNQYSEQKKTFGEEYSAFLTDVPIELNDFLKWLFKKKSHKINDQKISLEKILLELRHITLEQFWSAYDKAFSRKIADSILCKESYVLTCLYNSV